MSHNLAAELSLNRLLCLLESPCEMANLDFKETIDITKSRDRVELAKDVLAMANSGGGHIVIGVEDTTRHLTGIGPEIAATLRYAKTVNDQLAKYCGGYIKVLVAQHVIQDPLKGSIRLALIYVPSATSKIPAQDNGVCPHPENPTKQMWIFRRGDVYVRKGDESVKVETPGDLEAVRPDTELKIEVARDMLRAYTQRLEEYISRELPQLRSSEAPDEMCGQSLIQTLLANKDFLLLGSSGSGKSLHLKHCCLAALKQNELPLLALGGRYKREDIFRFIDSGVAPFSTDDTKTLCKAASICGVRVVLIIDGLNECQPYPEDLAKELHAFRLRYASRLILATQEIDLPAEQFGCEHVFMAPLTPTQKRFVYCNHARIALTADVDYLCQGFSNGYDLAVAGRCHDKGNASFTRVELYDRYCRESLPRVAETVLTAMVRRIAAVMGNEVTTFWPRYEFEQYAEKFLAAQGSPLGLLDQLKSSRLVSLTKDSFSFEHELLFDYFRAEQMRRDFLAPDSLAAELAKPKNQSLFPFVLPRQADVGGMRVLFTAILKAETLREVILGRCGEAARQALFEDCKMLYSAAEADLPGVTVRLIQDQPAPNALTIFSLELRGTRDWTQYEVLLLDALAISLDEIELRQGFFQLLDLTQWTLRAKAEETGRQSATSFNKLWAVIVGQLGGYSTKQLPFLRITASLRESLMRAHRQAKFCLQDQLLTRVSRDSTDHFSLAILLDCLTYCRPSSRDVSLYITVARVAWDSRIYHLRLNALHLLHSLQWGGRDLQPEELEMIQELLAQFETKDLFLNSSLLELLSVYGVMQPPVTVDEAAGEMKTLVAEFAPASGPIVTREQCGRAYGLLSNIFEDIYQGAYYEAYQSLGSAEKAALLTHAAQSRPIGFSTDWILHELLEYGGESALPVFNQFASSIDENSNSPDEAAVAYAFGMLGSAKFLNEPPTYTGPDTAEHRAWQIIGKILFWVSRSAGEPELAKTREFFHEQIQETGLHQVQRRAPDQQLTSECCPARLTNHFHPSYPSWHQASLSDLQIGIRRGVQKRTANCFRRF
jgi:hypothetical protein